MQEHLPLRTLPILLLSIAGLYLLLHPYQGLVHDSRLYTLQALNHLHPELYGNDVFLKYGSQDSYTLFTPLYAAVIALLGAESAASLITFASVVALLIAAWSFARTLMPAPFAWIGLGTLVLTPGFYGSGVTFSVLEGFATPRLIAEALVLFSLTAWLRGRRLLSAALLLAGMLLHPIMSFPAIILLLLMHFMHWDLRYWGRLWPLALVAVLAAAAALAGWLPITQWQFDAAWWPMADRVPHLILGHWTLDDWARIATLLATLGIAALCVAPDGRRLALAMLITCVVTLLLSWIGGDLLKIVLIVQGQAWRSLWLATAVAALLLPWIAASCWQGPPLRRCGVLLLVTAWVAGPMSLALCFSIPAVIAVACTNIRLPERYARFAVLGAGILLAVMILCLLALTWSEYSGTNIRTDMPTWLERLRTICTDGLLPSAVLLAVWYAAMRSSSRMAAGLLTVALALPVALVASAAAKPWFSERYPREAREAFAGWRSLIPPGSDVLWATKFASGSDPAGAWLLLERPSYFSSVQINSGLFSRPAAMELKQRTQSIPLSLPTESPIDITFGGELSETPSCSDIPVRYIVTQVPIPDAQLVSAPASLAPPFDRLELRLCPERRSATAD